MIEGQSRPGVSLPPKANVLPGLHFVFEATPGNNLLVKANPPHFTMLAATDSYLKVTGKSREEIIGGNVFDVFPSNPANANDTSAENLLSSFNHVIVFKEAHQLPIQRYDVCDAQGNFLEKFWRISNAPVLDEQGNIAYIVNSAEDITDKQRSVMQDDKIKLFQPAHELFRQAPLSIAIIKGPQLIVEMANNSIIEVWGKGPDVIGKPIIEVLPEMEGQGIIDIMHEVINSAIPYEAYETPYTLVRNGVEEKAWFTFVYQPYYEEAMTKPVGLVIFATEVTDRMMVRGELALKEQNLALAMQVGEFGFYNVELITPDLLSSLCSVSIKIKEWFGFDKLTIATSAIIDKIHPDDADAVRSAVQESIAGVEGGRHDLIYRVINPHDGSLTYLRSLGQVEFVNNKPTNLAGIVQDVTKQVLSKNALENSERTFRNLVSHAPVAIAVFRGENFIAEIANNAYLPLIDKTADEFIGKPFFESVPEIKEYLEPIACEVVRTGKPFFFKEYEVMLKRYGRIDTAYFNSVIEPLVEPDGLINGFMAVVHEITDQVVARKKVEELVEERTAELANVNEALIRTNQDLSRSNTNLEEFAYAASHDLKEPIRKIHFFSDRLKAALQNKLTASEEKLFDRIDTASQRMDSLIDSLISYGQLNFITANAEAIDLNDVLETVMQDLDLEVEQKNATVTVAKLFLVQGHIHQLQQAFQNLVSNALKYSRPGVPPQINISGQKILGGSIAVIVDPDEQNKWFYVIAVQDNGIGFEQENATRIFNVFTRLHGNNEFKGTGIGLSIVRKIIENHGGYITAESIPGVGSTFHVYLPLTT